jgi:hypothetical protein
MVVVVFIPTAQADGKRRARLHLFAFLLVFLVAWPAPAAQAEHAGKQAGSQ